MERGQRHIRIDLPAILSKRNTTGNSCVACTERQHPADQYKLGQQQHAVFAFQHLSAVYQTEDHLRIDKAGDCYRHNQTYA